MSRSARPLLQAGARFACLVAALALAGCRENGRLAAPDGRSARLTFAAAAGHAGELVVVAVSYLRQPSVLVPISTQTFTVTGSGEQNISVSFDLTECLDDAQHVVTRDDGCAVVAAVILQSATGVRLDSTSVGPLEVSIGGSASASVTLRAVGSVTITANSTLTVLDTMTAKAVVRDRENTIITGRPVSWSSSNPAVATINPNSGFVVALATGQVTFTANVQGVEGTKQVTVSSVPVTQVTVTLPLPVVLPGQTEQSLVVLRGASGQILTGRVITYQSTNLAIATVSSTGLVTAIARGTANIIATSELISGSVLAEVVTVPFGIVDANQPAASSYIAPGFNTSGGTVQVTRQTQGTYQVQFNGMGTPGFGASWGLTVSASNTVANASLTAVGAFCYVSGFQFALPLRATVRCESPQNKSVVDARFRLMAFADKDIRLSAGPLYAFSFHSDTNTFSPYVPQANAAFNSVGASMLVVPDTSTEGVVVEHVQNSTTPVNTLAFLTPYLQAGGRLPACSVLFQLFAPTSSTAAVCFTGSLLGEPDKHTHFLVRASGPPPGHPGGAAYVFANNGQIDPTRSWSSGTLPSSTRTGVGKFTVTFNGLDFSGQTVGVMVTPQVVGLMSACTHFLVSSNPVTVDVSCVDAAGAFTDQTGAVAVMVLR